MIKVTMQGMVIEGEATELARFLRDLQVLQADAYYEDLMPEDGEEVDEEDEFGEHDITPNNYYMHRDGHVYYVPRDQGSFGDVDIKLSGVGHGTKFARAARKEDLRPATFEEEEHERKRPDRVGGDPAADFEF